MAISEHNQRKADRAIRSVQDSNASNQEKELWEGYIEESLAATNGMTESQKIQSCTENQLTLICLLAEHLANPRPDSWKDVFIVCKRELMWLGFGITGLLAFRPQIAAVFSNIFGKG